MLAYRLNLKYVLSFLTITPITITRTIEHATTDHTIVITELLLLFSGFSGQPEIVFGYK